MRRYLVEGIVTTALPRLGYSGGNPRSGSPDRMMATWSAVLPPGASFFEQTVAGGGSIEERRVSTRVNDDGPRWRGVVESRRRMRVEVRAQGGGMV
jgi:hypothetical protein